jgi:hypothetical protein
MPQVIPKFILPLEPSGPVAKLVTISFLFFEPSHFSPQNFSLHLIRGVSISRLASPASLQLTKPINPKASHAISSIAQNNY